MSPKNTSFFERANNWIRNSVTVRLITIGILILLLLIPVSMVQELIREREYRQEEAIREVSAKWGEEQLIKGPVLSIPYYNYSKVYDQDQPERYKLVQTKEYAHFLPDELSINGVITPEVRYRGIYEVVVYNSEVAITGHFPNPEFKDWNIKETDILWNEAFISFGLTDLRSIQEDVSLTWNAKGYSFDPGVESNDIIESGISTRVPLGQNSASGKHHFSLELNFNGSSGLHCIPLGKSTSVTLESSWGDPSFDGAFLPDERDIEKEGFSAQWNILHLNRPYPQRFRGSMQGIERSGFGVQLIMPVDEYQKSMRSAKYAIMFITLTFLIFFFVQVLNNVRIHPIQYIIVGLALCVFYTLLIALSEHISFKLSYLISSLAIITLITAYTKSIFKSHTLTRLMGGILFILYLFIYTIIQLRDYALLMGSIGLFIVLAIIMYLSRKIDWYALSSKEKAQNNVNE